MPADWPTYKIHYRYRETVYHVTVHNGGAGTTVARVLTDNIEQPDLTVSMVDDRNPHEVEVYLN